jgi:hypothetical protein
MTWLTEEAIVDPAIIYRICRENYIMWQFFCHIVKGILLYLLLITLEEAIIR